MTDYNSCSEVTAWGLLCLGVASSSSGGLLLVSEGTWSPPMALAIMHERHKRSHREGCKSACMVKTLEDSEFKKVVRCACVFILASYPGLPSQVFLQPWKKKLEFFSTAEKKAVREGLGTRLCLFPIKSFTTECDQELELVVLSYSHTFSLHPLLSDLRSRLHSHLFVLDDITPDG